MKYKGKTESPGKKLPNAYRYGFNGKENDNEVKGNGNQQDYGLRIYDPRLERFLSVDPLTRKYPFYTPHQFAGNKPIQFIDLDGGEEKKPGEKNGNGKATSMAKDNSAAGPAIPASLANYKYSGSSSSASNVPQPAPSSTIAIKPKAEQIKDVGENFVTIGGLGDAAKLPLLAKIEGPGAGLAVGVNIYNAITAPLGSQAESSATEDALKGIAGYIAPRLGIPFVGEALLLFDVAIPILDLPNNPEVQRQILEQMKQVANSGDLKDKQNYEDYYKKVTPFKPPPTDVKIGPPQYH